MRPLQMTGAIRIIYVDIWVLASGFVIFFVGIAMYGFDILLAPIGIVAGFSAGSAFAFWMLGLIDRWGELNRQVMRTAVYETRTRIVYTTLFFVFLALFFYIASFDEKESNLIWVSAVNPFVLSGFAAHLFWCLRWETKNRKKIVTKGIWRAKTYTIPKNAQSK